MRITDSNLAFSSIELNTSYHETHEQLHVWDENSDLSYTADSKQATAGVRMFDTADIVELTPQSAGKGHALPPPANNSAANKKQILTDGFKGSIRDHLIKNIVEMMTGKKIHVFSPESTDESAEELAVAEGTDAPAPSDEPQRQGWGIDYQYHEVSHTTEGFAFSAQGTVTTDDGRTISFGAALEMSRETYEEISVSLKAGDALIDPLVIDLTGQGISLSDTTFSFDLDADGSAESIHTPGQGSGFLAIDLNENGSIDNGSELFGPSSGSGFSELAALDEDGNGWIDESDTAFGKLRIWQIASEEAQSPTPLLQNGIGAIATGKAATAYSLADSTGAMTGAIRETGIYLKEQGGAGFLQEVDLVA